MIGFLSPEGQFYECESYGHLGKVKEICTSLFNKSFPHIVAYEDCLLENGFVVIQARSIYKSVKHVLTDKQIIYLYDNYKSLNSMQKKAISLILLEEE